MELINFIEKLKKSIDTVVLVGERTHWIFTDGDEISAGWAENFKVVEIISENSTSVIARINYKWDD